MDNTTGKAAPTATVDIETFRETKWGRIELDGHEYFSQFSICKRKDTGEVQHVWSHDEILTLEQVTARCEELRALLA
jgi:hypothetical protein